MSKKSIFLIFIFSLIASILVATGTLLTINASTKKSLQNTANNIHSKYLENIIYNSKNDLVSGSYRIFRVQMASLIDQQLFEEYAIIQNGSVQDQSNDFEKKSLNDNYDKINISIWFDENKTIHWGEVVLLVPSTYQNQIAIQIFNELKSNFLLIIAPIILIGVISFFILRNLNLALSNNMNKVFDNQPLQLQGLDKLWSPILEQVSKLKKEYDHLKERDKERVKIEIKNEVARQISHDIRSPLSALSTLIRDNNQIDLNQRNLFENLIFRIDYMANNFLNDQLSSEKTVDLNINSFFAGFVSEKTTEFSNHKDLKIELTTNVPNETLFQIKKNDFSRALSNIINNAAEATNFRGEIIIHLSLKEDELLNIEIKDNGIGISPEKIPFIFEKGKSFKSKSNNSGHGLGLYFAKNVVSSCGGNIGITSLPGKGTTVSINIPYHENSKDLIFDYVLIDDDAIMRLAWKKRSKLNNVKLLTLANIDEFESHRINIDKVKSKIFIDSELGSHIRGEEFAMILETEGFKNLFIASAHPEEKFQNLGSIKYSGKTCPF